MVVRKYTGTDCVQLAQLFYDTVHAVCRKDYTEEQLDAWATGKVDLNAWSKSFSEHYTLVAEINGITVGFGDIDESGYLDRLYVHKDYQRQGVASAICDLLEQAVGTKAITTHASVTAKPFFEKRGYKTVKEQSVTRNGVQLTNYIMKKIKASSCER